MNPFKHTSNEIASGVASAERAGFLGRNGWKLAGAAVLLLVALTPFAVAQKGGSPAGEEGKRPLRQLDGPELIRRRAAWFYQQRAYPLKVIPAGARLQALEEMDRMIAAQKELGFQREGTVRGANVSTTPTWTLIGPQPLNSPFFQPFVSGRVTAIVIDPHDATGMTAYLGGALGGVWKTTNGGGTWTAMTDFQPSLATGSLALDPSTTPSTIYWGTGEEDFAFDSYYGAGVLKSTDGGVTWTQDKTFTATQPLDQLRNGPMIGAIAVQPHVTAPTLPVLLAAVQGSGSVLFSGIYRSTDGGNNWTHVLPAAGVQHIVGTDVVFDPADATGKTAYAALGNVDGSGGCNGVYKSTDAGATWGTAGSCGGAQIINVGTQANFGRIALGIGPPASGATAGELFAAIGDGTTISSNLLGVFKSTTGGATWTQLTAPLVSEGTGFCESQCFYDLVIKVDPANANVVYAGGAAINATLIQSLDGGTSWADVSNIATNFGIHVDIHAIGFSNGGNMLYIGSDGGVWSTNAPTNGTISWVNDNQTLSLSQLYSGFSVHPANPAFRSFGGTQDNGTERYTGNLAWDDTQFCGDGGFTIIDPLIPSTVYTDCAYIPSFLLGIAKSVQNGDSNFNAFTTTFSLAVNGINGTDNGNFIPPLVLDPSSTQNAYFGTFRIWQSTDGANSWNAISPDLTGGTNVTGGVLTTIAVAPSNSNTIYTGSSDSHVNVSTNALAGASSLWTDISTGLPPRAITEVAIDPISSTTAYVAFSGFSGFNGDVQGHVFRTMTGGPPWTDISTGVGCLAPTGALPNIPVNAIVLDPDLTSPQVVYVGTDIGVFQGTLQAGGTGACWQPLGMSSLPHAAVLSLKLHHPSRTLYAATHGRSVWQLPLGGLPAFTLATINPASDNAGDTSQPAVILNGAGFTLGSVVKWTINGTTDTITPVSSTLPTQLTINVPAKDLAASGVAQVSVSDSSQTPPNTNPLPFTVLAAAPSLITVTPGTATAPAAANLSLALTGTNFEQNSFVQLIQLAPMAASCIATSFTSSTALTATVQQSCLLFGGTFFVTANNPTPGGGSSNPSLAGPPTCCQLVVTGPVPANDNFANATPVTTSSFTKTEDTSGATTEAAEPPVPASCTTGESNVTKSVWYEFTTGSGSGSIEADTIGSAYDTILSVWTGGTESTLSNVACNDDIVLGVDRVSQLTFNANANTTYFFLVTAFVGDGGKLVFNLSTSVQPAAVYSFSATAPSPSTVTAGGSSTFTLTLTPAAGGGNSSVTLQPCTVSPATTTISCTYSTNPVALGTTPANTTVTIKTTPRVAAAGLPLRGPGPPVYGIWLVFAACALVLAAFAKKGTLPRRLAFGFTFCLLAAFLVFQAACGGGGSSSGGTPPVGTQPGAYIITINGQPAAASGPIAVNLTVQ